MLKQNELTKFVLDRSYYLLMASPDYAPRLSLVGAYSLFREFLRVNIDYEKVGRLTTDIDFDIFESNVSEVDYQRFQRVLSNSLGNEFNIVFFPLKTRRNSVTYTFKVAYKGIQTPKLKIDFSLTEGVKYFDSQPLYISLVKKLVLSNDLVDRRPKDKVDFYVVLNYLYSRGISKGELLRLLSYSTKDFRVNTVWFTDSGFSSALRSTRGFKGVEASKMERVMYAVRVVLYGIYSDNIPSNAIFKEDEWHW